MSVAQPCTSRLRYLAQLDPPTPVHLRTSSEEVSFLPMEAVGDDGGLDMTLTRPAQEVATGYTYAADGDLLLAKVTPCFENGKAAIIGAAIGGVAFATTEVYALRAYDEVDSRFLYYCLRSEVFRSYGIARLEGAGGLKRLSSRDLLDYPLWLPTPPEQRAIADFLDRETAKIDALIEKQNRLVALLRERRRAWHTSVLARDSGWPRVALRHICHAIVDCPHWTPDVVEESEFEAVRSGCIREGQYRPEAALLVDEVVYHARNRGISVEEGDVLFAREAPAGEACLVPAGRNLCLGQRTVLLKVDRAQIAPELVLANLYSQEVQDRFQVEMHGSTVGNLRLPAIRGTTIVVPPRSEQAGLVKDFVEGIARIDALIGKAEEFIALAKERRSALITAAVTGQIDVLGEALRGVHRPRTDKVLQ